MKRHADPLYRAVTFQWYATDWFVETAGLSLAARGAIAELRSYQWMHGAVPSDMAALARILRVPTLGLQKLWAEVEPFFPMTTDNGSRADPRLEAYRRQQQKRSEKLSRGGREGAKKRWTEQRGETDDSANS